MKYVVWKSNGFYCVTNKTNYYSYVQNARSIYRIPENEFDSDMQFVEWVCKTFKTTIENIEGPIY